MFEQNILVDNPTTLMPYLNVLLNRLVIEASSKIPPGIQERLDITLLSSVPLQ